MKQSNFLSEDLKKAGLENPGKMHDLGGAVLRLIFFAKKRPTVQAAEQAEERLLNGPASAKDLITTFKVITSYGEAISTKGTFSQLYYEPTSQPYTYITPFDRPFKSALDEAHGIISDIGNHVKWSKEKIEEEKKIFIEKVATFFNESQKQQVSKN